MVWRKSVRHQGGASYYEPWTSQRQARGIANRRSAPLRIIPRYVSPKRQFRILPRALARISGYVGAALTALEIYDLVAGAVSVDEPLQVRPQVPASPWSPSVIQRGSITSITMRLDHQFRGAALAVNVPPEAIPALTHEVIERGAEFRLSIGSQVRDGKIVVRMRKTALDGTDKRRRDAKSQDHARYVAALRFTNRTWGRASEVLDFYEAVINNLYVNGKLLRHSNDQGNVTVDWEGVATSLLINEVIDRSIGGFKQREKRYVLNKGYRGWQLPSTYLGHTGRYYNALR